MFVSHDAGGSWALPQDGPANVSVDELFWMGSTLVAATHGRGVFAADAATTRAAFSAVPASLQFDAQPVGTTASSRALTLSNAGGGS